MLFAVLAFVSALQEPQVVDGVIVRPRWAATPPADELIPAFSEWPARAEADLTCTALADGALRDCALEHYSPAGDRRIARHAQYLTRFFRLEPRLQDGRSVAGFKVRVRLRWG